MSKRFLKTIAVTGTILLTLLGTTETTWGMWDDLSESEQAKTWKTHMKYHDVEKWVKQSLAGHEAIKAKYPYKYGWPNVDTDTPINRIKNESIQKCKECQADIATLLAEKT